MKPVPVLMLVAALAGTVYIVVRAKAPTYTPPALVKPETLPTVLQSQPAPGEVVRVFDVEGMCCGGCAPKVYRALAAAPGVREAAVDFDTNTARAIVASEVEAAALEKAMTFDDYVAKARP